MTIHALHENPDWFPPFAQAFDNAGVTFQEWLMVEGAINPNPHHQRVSTGTDSAHPPIPAIMCTPRSTPVPCWIGSMLMVAAL